MPRPVPSGLTSLLPAAETQSIVDIGLRNDTTKYFCTGGSPIVLGGHTYVPQLLRVGELKEQLGKATNRVQVVIENVDQVFGLNVASGSRKTELAGVLVRRLYRNISNPAVAELIHIFTGKAVNSEVTEKAVTFDVIPDTTAAGTCLATETLSPVNGWRFPEVPDQAPPGSGDNEGGGIGGGHCFLEGTWILTPRGAQTIERLRIGWNVLSFDEDRVVVADTIEDLFEHVVTGFFDLRFSDGGSVRVTAEHPFLSEFERFKPVADFMIGENVWRFISGDWQRSRLVSARWNSGEAVTVYNLHVRRNHTYFANGFAVHNKIIPETV